MNLDPKDYNDDDDDDYGHQNHYDDDREDDYEDEMDRKYPHYSQESRNAGRFLGLDFPYVPGDPGL